MHRAYNFGAGPAGLPDSVMKTAQAEFLNWQETGCSVMEISHRTDAYVAMAQTVESDLRELMQIPDDYAVLFMQGGGRSQFSMVPLNLLGAKDEASYMHTGYWSGHAIKEAQRYGRVCIVADGIESQYTRIPDPSTWKIHPQSAYLHYVSNETVDGIQFPDIPDACGLPLVADMSSDILSRPIDVSRFGLIYAGTQKNMGPSGMAIVIIRRDLIGHAHPMTPMLYDYQTHAQSRSMYQTPPTYTWYMVGLVLKWLKGQGGLEPIAKMNERKAQRLYDFIDGHDFYHNQVHKPHRSTMNVVFQLKEEALNTQFVASASAAGLVGLKGHKAVGGMRASIYNAMPLSGVDALIDFMHDFAMQHG